METKSDYKSVIALGTFDGMHPGHVAVIEKAVRHAKAHGAKSAVFTFFNIPRSILLSAPVPIMQPHEKERRMREIGIDEVVMVSFDEAFSRLTPREFIEKIVADMNPIAVVTGEDYTFGYRAQGNTNTLKTLGEEMGFEVIVVETVRMVLPDGSKGDKISSTDIRRAISENRPELVEKYMHGKNTLDM